MELPVYMMVLFRLLSEGEGYQVLLFMPSLRF